MNYKVRDGARQQLTLNHMGTHETIAHIGAIYEPGGQTLDSKVVTMSLLTPFGNFTFYCGEYYVDKLRSDYKLATTSELVGKKISVTISSDRVIDFTRMKPYLP